MWRHTTMIIKIFKDNEEITCKISLNGKEENFSYISMVDYIYKKNPKIKLEFSEDILEEEKDKIINLFDQIYVKLDRNSD